MQESAQTEYQENQIILHVDMDAFYASVEMRDNPALKDKPLIIGAKPTERGVVATCNYEARKYGVRSAMNSKEAFRLCPKAVFLYPDFEKYKAVSEELHEILESYTKQAEYIALDEGYLDLTEVAKDFSEAERIGREIQRRELAPPWNSQLENKGYSPDPDSYARHFPRHGTSFYFRQVPQPAHR